MKIPNGMTRDQVVSIITDICSRFKFKYQIDIFDPDDVEQESFIICCEALERYDGIRPLENFLSFNLRNRLLNFVRDTKLKNIEMVTIPDEFDVEHNTQERLIIEIDNMMDSSLDPESRQDWLRLKDGVKVPTVRAHKLKTRVIEFYNKGLADEHKD